MERRTPVRRRVLDEDETKDALKILEKYVQLRYRTFTPKAQESADVEQATASLGQKQSARQSSRNGTSEEEFSFNGPEKISASEFQSEKQHFTYNDSSNDETAKFSKYVLCTAWLFRAFKKVIRNPIPKCVILVMVMLGYAFLGGYMFEKLEHDQQVKDMEIERLAKLEESTKLAESLLNNIQKFNCSQSNEKKCLDLINKAFVENEIKGTVWQWDFLNSVFFSATIFTTIGYGNIACKTDAGRIATIIYGLIGIPLMLYVLKNLGELLIKYAQRLRFFIKWCIRKACKLVRRSSNEVPDWTSDEPDWAEIRKQFEDRYNHEYDEEEMTPFPVKWALLIVFGFIVLCSFIVSIWEKWDFLTAFYFFFVSLSTIGFGDVIPEHPNTACALFLLYFIGLALFSMVYAILQERVENQHLMALDLVDEEYRKKYKALEWERNRFEREFEAEFRRKYYLDPLFASMAHQPARISGCANSLDQQIDELQLEALDPPKPYRDPSSSHGKVHKKDEKLATKVEKTPLSPAEPLEEEDEEDLQ